MRKIKTEKILLTDIKHIENSRLRDLDDVGDLMNDIKERGLLENIGIRLNDNALIFGNRRVMAYKKLGYKEIEANFYDGLNDEELLITNLAENIKRKDIGSIEIGRIIKILREKGMTNTEIASKLCLPRGRVETALSAYVNTLNTPFAKLVTYGNKGPVHRGIPETLIWDIQNSLTRARKLTNDDWNQILIALENGELTKEKISQLRKVILSNPQISIIQALDVLSKCKVVHSWFHFNVKEINDAMRLEKCSSENEFVKLLVRRYNEKLLF